MTLFGQTIVLYLVIGGAVAGAVYLGNRCPRRIDVAVAVPFWPLYLPLLLANDRHRPEPTTPRDELDASIAQVDAELDAALGGLNGWTSDVLAREKSRVRDLRSAWLAQADRIRAMDDVLALPEYAEAEPIVEGDRLAHTSHARQQNVDRLRELRRHAHDALAANLAWVREVVSMIHLAKFSGEPAARAEELVAQIAAAVEGLSAAACESSGV